MVRNHLVLLLLLGLTVLQVLGAVLLNLDERLVLRRLHVRVVAHGPVDVGHSLGVAFHIQTLTFYALGSARHFGRLAILLGQVHLASLDLRRDVALHLLALLLVLRRFHVSTAQCPARLTLSTLVYNVLVHRHLPVLHFGHRVLVLDVLQTRLGSVAFCQSTLL